MASFIFWLSAAFIVYTYALYPLLAHARARRRPRPVARCEDYQPSISVILAAYNEAERLPARIENLLAQEYPAARVEVIVASDGSTDGTNELLWRLAEGLPRLRPVVLEVNQGKAAAVNAAVAAASGELLVFADARQHFAPDALARLAENFADPQVGSVSGELVLAAEGGGVAEQVGLYWRYEKWIRKSEALAGSMLGATGAIYAIRRALWRPLPTGTILDDMLTPMRIVLGGWRAVFDERALAFDRAVARAGHEFRRKARTLAGNFQAFAFEPGMLSPRRNPQAWLQLWSHKVFRLLVPYALILLLLASLAAPGWFYRLAAAGQLAFYGAALAGWLAERRGHPLRLRLVSLAYTFVTLNLAAMAGLRLWLAGHDTRRIWTKNPQA